MGASKTVILKLLTTLHEHKIKVPSKGTWKKIHEAYNIGTLDLSRSRGSYFITDVDKQKIKQLLIANGVNPAKDTVESLKNESRTESAKRRNDEKSLSKAVKSDYVNVRFFGDNATLPKCFIGMPYYEVVKLNLDAVVVIENFDTFVLAVPENLPLPMKPKNTAFIYRGDNEASPKGLTQFLKAWDSKVLYWGDFDPAGLAFATTKEKYDAIILPVIDKTSLEEHSDIKAYYKQESFMPRLAKNPMLKPFIEVMKEQRLAVMQEKMMAMELPLMLLNSK